MTLHLIKLCVGAGSLADLKQWAAKREMQALAAGEIYQPIHTTRMMPKRVEELLDGGSLYWVIRGQIAARQQLVDLRAVKGDDNISRCQIIMQPNIVPVWPGAFRRFQGWRYLTAEDAPADMSDEAGQLNDMPDALRRELHQLGLV